MKNKTHDIVRRDKGVYMEVYKKVLITHKRMITSIFNLFFTRNRLNEIFDYLISLVLS